MQTRQQAIERQNSGWGLIAYAKWNGEDSIATGRGVKDDQGRILCAKKSDVITVERCKELVACAERVSGLEVHQINIDMDEWDYENISDEHYENAMYNDCGIPKRKSKSAQYFVKQNRLLIWENDMPVYENHDGVVCRDATALADCIL